MNTLDKNNTICNEFTFEEQMKLLEKDISNAKYISNLDEKICFELVSQDGMYIKYIPKERLTEEICFKAVKQNRKAIEYIPKENQTEKVCLEVVRNTGSDIKYIKNRTSRVCLYAFLNDFELLEKKYIQKGIDEFIQKNNKLTDIIFCYIDLKYFINPFTGINYNYQEKVSNVLDSFNDKKYNIINVDIKSLEYLSDYLLSENSGNHYILNDKDDIQLLQKIAKSNNELIIIDNENITNLHKKIANKII